MITLNLLPPIKKQEFHLTQIYLMIKNLIIIILFLTIIAAITLLVTKLLLQNHFTKIVAETTLTTKYATTFNKSIKEFNQKLSAVDKIQKSHVSWTKFFINFAQLVPEDVGIDNVTINGNRILINGVAKTRSQFLKFKDNLEKSDLFSEIVTPLENLLKKDDVVFNLKASINLGKLQDYEY